MSDNSNHTGRPPRKPGGPKGPHRGARGTGPRAGARPGGKSDGRRPRQGDKSGPRNEFKPREGAGGARDFDKPFKKPFRKAPEGDRPVRRREDGDAPARSFSKSGPKRFDKPRRVVHAEPQTAPSAFEGERIAKTMARVGLCSRRDAEAWIAEGRVSVNGEVLTTPAVNVTMADRITVDGKPLGVRERTRLFLYNKPRGLVTTDHDPEGRPTVFDSLPRELPRVISIGRLDINTEGLLLLTNDGGLARVLELPSTGWLRRYRVRANGETDQAKLDELRKGISIDGVDYAGIEATLDRVQGANVWLTMGLREGKNREIKRVLEHLGLAVNRLIRLSYGPFQLADLAEGAVEEVKTRIIAEQIGPTLAEQAGADFESPVIARGEADEEAPLTRGGGSRAPKGAGARGARGRAPEAAEDRPRLDRPKPGPRKHVSVLRENREADATAPRRRIERAETADRKGRAVSVERIVAPGKKPRGETRNGRRFAREKTGGDEPRPARIRTGATSGERPRTGRNAKAPAPREDRRGEKPRASTREAEGGGRTFSKPAGAGRSFDKPRSEGRSRPEGGRPPRAAGGGKPGGGKGRPGGGGKPGGRPGGSGGGKGPRAPRGAPG